MISTPGLGVVFIRCVPRLTEGPRPVTITRDSSDGRAEQPAVDDQHNDFTLDTPQQLLRLSVQHPAPGLCVVRVYGDLDMLTAPLLDECLHEQLGHTSRHLVVDLEGVNFLGASGLASLVQARETAETIGVVVHLAGLAKKAVRRPLAISFMLPAFRCYPTLAHALSQQLDWARGEPSHH